MAPTHWCKLTLPGREKALGGKGGKDLNGAKDLKEEKGEDLKRPSGEEGERSSTGKGGRRS